MRLPVAIVTGGASGVGRAVCANVSGSGGTAVMLDNAADHGSVAAAATGASFIRCDVASRDDWRNAAEEVQERFGAPTFIALNAGVMTRPPSASVADDILDWIGKGAYERVMRVNVDGVVYGLEALVPLMSGGGAIVVTASMAGLTPLAFDPFYAASKHAVIGLVRSLAPVLAPRNIRLNAFCPGGIATRLVPAQIAAASPPLMSADEAAQAILDISSGLEAGEAYIKTGPGAPLTKYAPPDLPLS